jgi:hypothetical protein
MKLGAICDNFSKPHVKNKKLINPKKKEEQNLSFI